MTGPGDDAASGAPLPEREYHQLLRGPRFAWWKALLALALGLGLAFAFALASIAVLALLAAFFGWLTDSPARISSRDLEGLTPIGFLATTLALATLAPASLLATRIVHGRGAGRLSSVAGHLRWQWMFRCMAVLVPVFAACVALDLLLDPPASGRHPQWTLLLPIVILTVPLQSAGEEYISRGLILQNIGGLIANPRVAAVVATVPSVLLFAAAHGSLDAWIFLDLSIFAAACTVLTLRTGGLEAAIALHAINNAVGMCGTLLVGGWVESFVDTGSVGYPLDPLATLLVSVLVVPLLLRMARRNGIARTSDGTVPAVGAATLRLNPRASVAP